MTCAITPITSFQSTNLNSKIDNFSRLADRIVRSLGAPLISIEVHQDQLFENISIACEMFSRYAGYTKEYLIFDSQIYKKGTGIRLDHLYTLANPNLSLMERLEHKTPSRDTGPYIETAETVYIATTGIPSSYFASSSALSGIIGDGVFANQIIDSTLYKEMSSTLISGGLSLSSLFTESRVNRATTNNPQTNNQKFNNMFDYDVMDYRKVIAITDFEEGSTTGINTLFTIEQTLAQQTYFSYAMGNFGFDLISWYCVKNWLETREKVLATKRSYEFDERTQYLRMYPEPTDAVRFYGVLASYVERPIRDIIKEPWVYQYALALTKITVGYVRGKYGQVALFGGQLFSQDIMTQGQSEKEKLEQDLFSTSAGFGSSDPVSFFVG
jgi:hypothetical protein